MPFLLPPRNKTDYNYQVPKELTQNLIWRQQVAEACKKDRRIAAEVLEACRIDIKFFCNTFVFIYEPRNVALELPPTLPWILWRCQEELLDKFRQAMREQRDIFCLKSRGVGASWCAALVNTHGLLFREGFTGLLMSRVEDLVDQKNNMTSIMAKCDHIMKYLPDFFNLKIESRKNFRHNPRNGAQLIGASSAAEAGTGMRATLATIDEVGKAPNAREQYNDLGAVTYTRALLGTPNEPGSFWENVWTAKDSTENKKNFPLLFQVKPVRHEIPWHAVDEWVKDSYYDEEGQLRSPWFNSMAQKLAIELGGDEKTVAARELCCKFVAASESFFEDKLLKGLEENCRDPLIRREWNPIRQEFTADQSGLLFQWIIADPTSRDEMDNLDGRLKKKRYAIGCDVSAGLGQSNSVAQVFDIETGEQVAEWATALMEPPDFADGCVALAKWYNNAFMLWEAEGGTGSAFGKRVMALHYPYIYYRANEEAKHRRRKVEKVPGWSNNKGSAGIEFWTFKRDLRSGKIKIFSKMAIRELHKYVTTDKGSAEHSESQTTELVTAAKANHGDRAMALIMGWKAARENPYKHKPKPDTIPIGSFADRQARRRTAMRQGGTTYY